MGEILPHSHCAINVAACGLADESIATMREENSTFLNNLPPLQKYAAVDPEDPQWNVKMVDPGKIIRDNLISNYPLAFAVEGDKNRCANIGPFPMYVEQGAKPVNKTFC